MTKKINPKNDNRLKIFIIIAIALVMLGLIFSISTINKTSTKQPKLVTETRRHDFGVISMADGLAKHVFKITNDGDADLVLSNIKTSCMCTSVIIKDNDEKSPKFSMHNNAVGWTKTVARKKTVDMEVIFDPNAHGPNATGEITRTIELYSNDEGKTNKKTLFTIYGDVIK